jgi:hypothetical protein
VIRNYYVITTMFPPGMRFQFEPHVPTEFPPFDPRLSPSQMFQFSYNANCSYYETSYEHDITQFVHHMISTGDGIADLSRLPLIDIEVTLGSPIELRPLFAAFMFCPLIFGVRLSGIARPDILYSIAPMLIANSNINIVDLHDCHIESGIMELAAAINHNPNSNVTFWDLSGNPFSDLAPFCSALARTKAAVFYLNLARTNLTRRTSKLLLKAIHANRNLWRLRYLNIHGADIGEEELPLLQKVLERLAEKGKGKLKELDFSYLRCPYPPLLTTLAELHLRIEHLDIGGASRPDEVFPLLIAFIKSAPQLSYLGLRNTGLKTEQLAAIIAEIKQRRQITDMTLDLSELNLNGRALQTLIIAFENALHRKWSGLHLNRNGMTTSDLQELSRLLVRLSGFRRLSLEGNFLKRDENLPTELVNLLNLGTLEHLSLSRCDLREALLPLIDALSQSEGISSLDISHNRIGQAGLNQVSKMLQINSYLTDLFIDGSFDATVTPVTFCGFLDAVIHSHLINCDFPAQDMCEVVESLEKIQRPESIALLSAKQIAFQRAIEEAQAAAGFHPMLANRELPELESVINHITKAIARRLNGRQPTQHSAAAWTFGLPMPHLGENGDGRTDAFVIFDEGVETTVYAVESANAVVVEKGVPNEMLQIAALRVREEAAEGEDHEEDESEPDAGDDEGEDLEEVSGED